MVKNRGGRTPTGRVDELGPPPDDWRDHLSYGLGRRVRGIEGRWQFAQSYSDAEAAQDVRALVAILGAVQRELDEVRDEVKAYHTRHPCSTCYPPHR